MIDRLQKDSDAVAACSFGVVERHIGASKHGDGGFAGSGKGEADAESDGESEPGDNQTAYRVFHPFGDSQGIIAGGLRQDEEELVASEAPEEIIGAKAAGDDLDDLPESGVACSMTRRVVDLFEVIDVDERDG